MPRTVPWLLAVACVAAPVTGWPQAPAPGLQASPTAPPEVRTARARSVPNTEALRLPARTEPIEEARIYARSNGTLAERRVDLGDRVAAGAVLARIAAPEVDQAAASARASLEQARARERLAQVTLDRNRPLVAQNFISSSRLDDLGAALDVARADTAAAAAEVRRYEALKGFQTVRAPFAGTIVERSVERGDRVNADGGNSAPALFRIARLNVLRVVIDVPQSFAAGLKVGQAARVSFQEFPGQVFDARLERLSGRIDAATASMRVELNLPNADLKVPAGLRGEVALSPSAGSSNVSVPANAVLLVAGRPQVATVDAEQRLRFRPIQTGRTVGRDIEVRQGLEAGTLVVLNVNALLKEGQLVTPVLPPPAPT